MPLPDDFWDVGTPDTNTKAKAPGVLKALDDLDEVTQNATYHFNSLARLIELVRHSIVPASELQKYREENP